MSHVDEQTPVDLMDIDADDDNALRVADEVVGPDKISPLGEVLGKRTARDVHRARPGTGERRVDAVKRRAHNERHGISCRW